MKNKFYLSDLSWFWKSIFSISLLFTLVFNAGAQTQLVKWDFSGFVNTPTASLPQNAGKLVTAVGQNQAAFISVAGTTYDPPYICNGWDVPANSAYFLINFSTLNYANNSITFYLGAFQFGAKSFQPQYSIAGPGGPWTDFGTAVTFPAAGGSQMFTNVPLPITCDDHPDIYVRILSTTTTINTGGDYIDEIEVYGFPTMPTSVSTPNAETRIMVYPNPTTDVLNVEVAVENEIPLTLCLIDMQGRVLQSKFSDIAVGNNSIMVDMKSLSSGIYMLQVSRGKDLIHRQKVERW